MTWGATRLRVEGATRPLGVDRDHPRFDWEWLPGDDVAEFRLELDNSGGDGWRSAWQAPGPGFLEYDGPALRPRTRYRWRLAFRGQDGRSWASADAEFVTGLRGQQWSAAWISTQQENALDGVAEVGPRQVTEPPAESRPLRPVPEFLVKFDLTPEPEELCLLRVTALGVLDLTVNGSTATREVFAPGWTDSTKTLQYQSVDITPLLKSGTNELTVRVADGWALGNICWFGTAHYSPFRALLAQVEILRPDGCEVVVTTGGHWRARESEIEYADLQNGCDLRIGGGPTTPLDVIEVTPQVGELVGGISPPVVPIARFAARSAETAGDELVVDFGQNVAGWVELTLPGHDGAPIRVRHAEVLDADGSLYTASLRSTTATDEYRFAGPVGETRLAPSGTVHGFRYAGITGLGPAAETAGIEAVAVSADLTPQATFECSDPDLNQLHSNVLWSARANLLSVPTDCPQRDERLGWTGDAQIFAATAALNFRVLEFFRKWLRDVRDAMTPDGAVTNVAPDVLSTSLEGRHGGTAGWGDAIVIVPWELHQATGDRAILTENLDAMGAWLAYLERNSEQGIRPAEGFGDWLAFTPTPLDLVATAFFAHAARLASRCAAVVGDPRTAVWKALADRVRNAWRDRFLVDGLPTADSQSAHVLALHFDLLDDSEREASGEALVALLEANRFRLSTGFLATPYLLPVLSSVGREDVALQVLLGDEPPSWLYPVRHGGATSIWERWDSWTEEGGFQDPEMNSFNHYAYGAVDEWICDRLGGIRRVSPGYARVEISPCPSPAVTWARHSRDTPYGRVSVDWAVEADVLRITTEVPEGMLASLTAPLGYAVADRVPESLPAGRATFLLRRAS